MANYDELRRVGLGDTEAKCVAKALDNTKDIFGNNPTITSSVTKQSPEKRPTGMLGIDGQAQGKAALGLSAGGGSYIPKPGKINDTQFVERTNRVEDSFEPCRQLIFQKNGAPSP